MKLERLHEYVLPVVALVGGLAFALFCGFLLGEGKTSYLLLIFYGIFLMVTLLVVRERIWMAIPFAWALQGQIPELPLPFAVRDLAVISVFGCFLLLKALKLVRIKPKFEAADFWMLVMLVYLASVLIRNPVGTEAMGSERVGGRPYLTTGVAVLAFWVMARVVISDRTARLLPFFLAVSMMIEGLLSLITFYFPGTVPFLSRFYSTLNTETYNAQDVRVAMPGETSNRLTFLLNFGQPVVRVLCSWYRPLTLVNPLYIFRFLFFCAALVCILLSGFRTAFFFAGICFVFGSYFRRGIKEVLRLFLIGIPVLCLLLILQGRGGFELPLSAQRALSFLPGKWNMTAVNDARASTEWRVRMWKDAIFTDKYIESKTFGDGFGFTKRQLEWVKANSLFMSDEEQQEHYLVVGGVHSGPVSAIRYVGAVGLLIFTGMMISMARLAWQLIVRSKNSVFFPLALFVGVPIVWEPFNYYLLFGGFDGAFPSAIFNLGLLKVLKNSMDARDERLAKEATPEAPTGSVLLPVRRPLAPAPAMGAAFGPGSRPS